MEQRRKRGILAVSFGTSYEESCRRTIGALEEDFAGVFPYMPVKRAFTSAIIMRIWKERGVEIPDTMRALAEMAEEGIEEVLIQPTHLLAGEEYEKLCAQAEGFRERFRRMEIGVPLLHEEEDLDVTGVTLDNAAQGLYTLRVALQYKGDPIEVALTIQ